MKISRLLLTVSVILMASCTKEQPVSESGTLSFSTSIENFKGEIVTRTNLAGTAFENGDKIKLKIVCPYSTHTQFGETTNGNSFDAFWLLKWNSGKWATLTSADGFDINGDYSPSASPDVYECYEAQQTPYVYTAQTWSEEQIFIAGNGTRVEQYSNVFHADQSKVADYKASDLMWAQAIQQTGSYNVHLSFRHVMSALMITVSDLGGAGISEDAVLTVEGMPDMDQTEVIVGDYYVAASKVNSNDYGYINKHTCTKPENGKVLGVAVVNDAQRKTLVKPVAEIARNATYTACNTGSGTYRLIVPPCTLSDEAVIWIRDGEKRYSMPLSQTVFEPGTLYKVTMQIN